MSVLTSLFWIVLMGICLAVSLQEAEKHHLNKYAAFFFTLFFPYIAVPFYYFYGRKLDKKYSLDNKSIIGTAEMYKNGEHRILKLIGIIIFVFLIICGFAFWFGANDPDGTQSLTLRIVEIALVAFPSIFLILIFKKGLLTKIKNRIIPSAVVKKWIGIFSLIIIGTIVISASSPSDYGNANVGGYVFGGFLVLLAIFFAAKIIFQKNGSTTHRP